MNIELIPPCSYQGGKQAVVKQIIDYIFNNVNITKDTMFYDLCCGSGTITLNLINRGIDIPNIIMLDKGSFGLFYKSIGDGFFNINKFLDISKQVPRDKSKIQNYMKQISKQNANIDEEYYYILLQASAFGGKQVYNDNGVWKNTSFRSYWQPTKTSKRKSVVNPMQPMIDVLEQRVIYIANKLKGIKCYHTDIYKILNNKQLKNGNNIIYIDPPYMNTTKYKDSFDIFNFINELLKITTSPIFISEKKQITNKAIQLKISSTKGGISGNTEIKKEEWLNILNI